MPARPGRPIDQPAICDLGRDSSGQQWSSPQHHSAASACLGRGQPPNEVTQPSGSRRRRGSSIMRIPPTRRPVFLVLNQKPCRPRPWEHDDLGAHPRASATHSPSGCHQSTWSSTETWLLVRVSASGSTSWASSPSTTALPYPPTPDPITANRSCPWVPDPRHDKAPQRLAGARGARHHRNRTRDRQVSRCSVITIASSPPAEQVPNVETSARRLLPTRHSDGYRLCLHRSGYSVGEEVAGDGRYCREDRRARCGYEAPSTRCAGGYACRVDGRQGRRRGRGRRADPCLARKVGRGARTPRRDPNSGPASCGRDGTTAPAAQKDVETPKGLASLGKESARPFGPDPYRALGLSEGLSARPALEGLSPLGGLPTPERLLMGARTVTARHVLDGCGGCT